MSKNTDITPVFASPFSIFGIADPFDVFGNTGLEARPARRGLPGLKVDVRETEGSYIVEADLPGAAKDDIALSFEDGALTIAYEKTEDTETPEEETDKGTYLVRERRHSFVSAKRTIELGDIDEDSAKAKFEDGVLTVTFDKKEPENTKKTLAID